MCRRTKSDVKPEGSSDGVVEALSTDECTQWFRTGVKGTTISSGNPTADEEASEVEVLKLTGYHSSGLKLLPFLLVVLAPLAGICWVAFTFTRSIFAGYDDNMNYTDCDPAGHWAGGAAISMLLILLAFLMFEWCPEWWVWATKNKYPLTFAPTIVVTDTSLNHTVVRTKIRLDEKGNPRTVFTFRHTIFAFRTDTKTYQVAVSPLPSQKPPGGDEGLDSPTKSDSDHDSRGSGQSDEISLNPYSLIKAMVGLSTKEIDAAQQWYGENIIIVPIPSRIVLFMHEILSPFMWFQLFSVTLWGLEIYYIYACIIFGLSFITSCVNLEITRDSLVSLSAMARHEQTVTVIRGTGERKVISSRELVPGDLFIVEPNRPIPCDALLLTGEAIVNESMLTGESVPVVKAGIPQPSPYPVLGPVSTKHQLFTGTVCMQATPTSHETVVARVWKTGFSTSKGRLIRSILFPKETRFDMNRDAFRMLAILFGLAIIGFIITLVNGAKLGQLGPADVGSTVLEAMDLVTIVVPPALPTTLLIGMSYAITRLKKQKIFSIAPSRINVSGNVDLMCFDKTGTLTEDGLELMLARPAKNGHLVDHIAGADVATVLPSVSTQLEQCMGSCHALRAMVASNNGEISRTNGGGSSSTKPVDMEGKDSLSTGNQITLIGEVLEIKMFEAIGWRIGQNNKMGHFVMHDKLGENSATVKKTFDFTSDLQRMSVVAEVGGELWVFLKGAPEVVAGLCHESTLPRDWSRAVHSYTSDGFRVLACAGRPLKHVEEGAIPSLSRTAAEGRKELTFLGLLVFENALKPETTPTIKVLSEARIRSVMITGDHALTAIYIAGSCGIITDNDKHLLVAEIGDEPDSAAKFLENKEGLIWKNARADMSLVSSNFIRGSGLSVGDVNPIPRAVSIVLTGRVFDLLVKRSRSDVECAAWLARLIERVSVAARFSPYQKQLLVEMYGENKHITGFCGDGANDCGALKSADAGLSLSPYAEASIAAPFTSQITNISSVLTLLKEGRAAITTAFCSFKFMAMYAMIQYVNTVQSYIMDTTLSSYQFMFQDVFTVMPLFMFLGATEAYQKLVPHRPPSNLRSPAVIGSILIQAGLCLAFQIFCRLAVQAQPWYFPQGMDPSSATDSSSAVNQTIVNGTAAVVAAASDPCADDPFVPGFENTVIVMCGNIQYVWMVMVLSVGPPFRKAMYTNKSLVLAICGVLILTFTFTLADSLWIQTAFSLMRIPVPGFRWALLAIIFSGLVASYLAEMSLNKCVLYTQDRRRKREEFRDRENGVALEGIEMQIDPDGHDMQGDSSEEPVRSPGARLVIKPSH